MISRRPLLCLPALAWPGAAAVAAVAAAAESGEPAKVLAQPPLQPLPPLLLVNAVYPPFVNPPDHPQGEGLDVEIARQALRRAGREMRVQLLPWKRALLMLENGQGDLTTTISRNGDRDRYLRWTQSYRNGANYHFYTRKGSPLRLAALGDLAGHHLGIVEGFFYPEAITGQRGAVIDSARDVTVLARKLQAGRIDAMVVTGIRGAWEIREAGLADRLVRQPFQYSALSPNYMAFSKLRCDEPLVAATRAGLRQMLMDGRMGAIERHYLKDLTP